MSDDFVGRQAARLPAYEGNHTVSAAVVAPVLNLEGGARAVHAGAEAGSNQHGALLEDVSRNDFCRLLRQGQLAFGVERCGLACARERVQGNKVVLRGACSLVVPQRQFLRKQRRDFRLAGVVHHPGDSGQRRQFLRGALGVAARH